MLNLIKKIIQILEELNNYEHNRYQNGHYVRGSHGDN